MPDSNLKKNSNPSGFALAKINQNTILKIKKKTQIGIGELSIGTSHTEAFGPPQF